jgi:hypothetical protein
LTAAAAGYSGKPLAEKLGIKAGMTVVTIAPPRGYRKLLGNSPRARVLCRAPAPDAAPVIALIASLRRAELSQRDSPRSSALAPAGMLWISWPKGSSGVATDLTENVVREIGLATGLVDVKVCAVDATWSGLKFVRRVKER